MDDLVSLSKKAWASMSIAAQDELLLACCGTLREWREAKSRCPPRIAGYLGHLLNLESFAEKELSDPERRIREQEFVQKNAGHPISIRLQRAVQRRERVSVTGEEPDIFAKMESPKIANQKTAHNSIVTTSRSSGSSWTRRLVSRFFPPYEVSFTEDAARDFLARNAFLSQSLITNEVLSVIKTEADKTVYSIRIDGLKPEHLALVIITNVVSRHLASGTHHIYRGVLSAMGQDLLKVWNAAVKEMLERGFCSEAEAREDLDWIKQQIKEMG